MTDYLRGTVNKRKRYVPGSTGNGPGKNPGNDQGNNQGGSNKGLSKKTLIIIAVCVAVVALGVGAYFIVTDSIQSAFLMQGTTAAKGVTVNDIPISEMTLEQAKAATANIPSDVLGKVTVTIDIDGQKYNYKPEELGITTNYDEVIDQAVNYVHTGTLDERKKAIAVAESTGMAFTVKAVATKDKLSAVLLPLKTKLDRTVADASFTFMPWGYTADGTAYVPDKQALIESCANKTVMTTPELVRLTAEEMPNKLRYQYWKTKAYLADYIPPDANISRFFYQPDVQGLSIDMESVMDTIISQTQSGAYSEITAPVQKTDSTVKLDSIKQKTQLIASWTSCYASHAGYNRNWNVSKMSGIINGVIIQPGETWSINKEAGNRTVAGGWKKAPGIIAGGYTMQPGGGVCQISSTVYNAAIRANLEIKEAEHHSISSNYIPPGLDATISSPSPDLKLKNNNTEPIYIISYFNTVDQNVTVEIYGQSVTDPQNGDVILDFSWDASGKYGDPGMNYVYGSSVAPDGHVLAAGESYQYAAPRYGETVHTFKHTLKLDGTEIKKDEFTVAHWTPSPGTTYVYDPDPSTITPTPSP